jgi:hypothetical protein
VQSQGNGEQEGASKRQSNVGPSQRPWKAAKGKMYTHVDGWTFSAMKPQVENDGQSFLAVIWQKYDGCKPLAVFYLTAAISLPSTCTPR